MTSRLGESRNDCSYPERTAKIFARCCLSATLLEVTSEYQTIRLVLLQIDVVIRTDDSVFFYG